MDLREKLAGETCSERLRNLRLYRNVGQAEVASAVPMLRNRISYWETMPSRLAKAQAEDVGKVCDFLGGSFEWVMFGRGPVEPPGKVVALQADVLSRAYATTRHVETSTGLDPATAGQMLPAVYQSLLAQEESAPASEIAKNTEKKPRQIGLKFAAGPGRERATGDRR